MKKRLVCFDVDGTIVDTRELNLEAYLSVGVVMPSHAWGLRWQQWLPDVVGDENTAVALHQQKVKNFSEILNNTDLWDKTLPSAEIAREFSRTESIEVQFLTAASLHTAAIILDKLKLRAPLAANLTIAGKRLHLDHAIQSGEYASVTYIDDDASAIGVLRALSPKIRAVHFTGQTFRELRWDIREAVWRA